MLKDSQTDFLAPRETLNAAPGLPSVSYSALSFPNAPEPGAVPASIAPWVKALSPEAVDAALATMPADAEALADRLDLAPEFEATGLDDPAAALAVAVAGLSRMERFDLSKRYPLEAVAIAGIAVQLTDADPDTIRSIHLAPEVNAALEWIFSTRPRDAARVYRTTEVN